MRFLLLIVAVAALGSPTAARAGTIEPEALQITSPHVTSSGIFLKHHHLKHHAVPHFGLPRDIGGEGGNYTPGGVSPVGADWPITNVPGPVVGAGMSGILSGCAALWYLARRRRAKIA